MFLIKFDIDIFKSRRLKYKMNMKYISVFICVLIKFKLWLNLLGLNYSL